MEVHDGWLAVMLSSVVVVVVFSSDSMPMICRAAGAESYGVSMHITAHISRISGLGQVICGLATPAYRKHRDPN